MITTDNHKTLLHQTTYHVNQLKTNHLAAKHCCHHIHSGLTPKHITRIHYEDEDTPILAIPFEVTWKATWLSEDIVRSLPTGNSAIHNYGISKQPLRKKTRSPPPNPSASHMRMAPPIHNLYHPPNQPHLDAASAGSFVITSHPTSLDSVLLHARDGWTSHLRNPESETTQNHKDISPTRIHDYAP